jgi:hypothetical protein
MNAVVAAMIHSLCRIVDKEPIYRFVNFATSLTGNIIFSRKVFGFALPSSVRIHNYPEFA